MFLAEGRAGAETTAPGLKGPPVLCSVVCLAMFSMSCIQLFPGHCTGPVFMATFVKLVTSFPFHLICTSSAHATLSPPLTRQPYSGTFP